MSSPPQLFREHFPCSLNPSTTSTHSSLMGPWRMKYPSFTRPGCHIDVHHYRNSRAGTDISMHIRLPHLKSLAVSVPGFAADLVYYIDAPDLHHLHLDGSRGGSFIDEDDNVNDDCRLQVIWQPCCIRRLMRSLKNFASRCQSLRHLAITSTFLTGEDWEWILFGDGNGPPFPELESISIHRQSKTSPVGSVTFGLDDDLLLRFSLRTMSSIATIRFACQ
ncbi:hypothetical protein AX15_005158 [Amanita polypyramis BW_CC]|nr:hypothetical protein AX15_005158 [Amanita polypyramis BW_CC]